MFLSEIVLPRGAPFAPGFSARVPTTAAMAKGENIVDYNSNKYWVEDSDLLTEAEKIQMAQSLRELELEGVIEWRDGTWQLVPQAREGYTK